MSPVRVPLRVHAWTWAAFAALILLLVAVHAVFRDAPVWDGWQEARELRRPAYAETVHVDRFFRTQSNTWSNLAYVLVGFYAAALALHDRRAAKSPETGYLRRTPAMGALYGLSCCFLGFGSGLFHASLTRWGQQLDVAAMYSPLVVLLAVNAGRWIPEFHFGARRLPSWPLWAAAAVLASTLLYIYKWSMSSGRVLPALILAVSVFTMADLFAKPRKTNLSWLVLATAALAVAVFFRQMDIAGRVTGPDHWLQGHALWHLFTALALWSMHAYYRTESPHGAG